MATFTWSVAMTERSNDDSKVVTVVHYKVEGVDGDDMVGAQGSMSFDGDATADGFIAFESLTESTVLGWVKDALGAEKVAEIEAAIDAKIAERKNPPVVAELPWAE